MKGFSIKEKKLHANMSDKITALDNYTPIDFKNLINERGSKK